MHTDTPPRNVTPSASYKRAVRDTLSTINLRWIQRPEDLHDPDVLQALLAPIAECISHITEPSESSHGDRVGRIATAIALAAGWNGKIALQMRAFGSLHDLGKLALNRSVLMKAGSLSRSERLHVQRHPELGYRMLAGCSVPVIEAAARVAWQHHEAWDGSGYPRGLAGPAIDPCARIISIADVYDALTSARPYRAALPDDVAMEIMQEGRCTQFDPELFDVFSALKAALPGQHAWS
jgi:HD-GYP domain-containing protein (c-di-GMP phosphodiesterase class II)